jgi:hypothetical protein
VRLPPLPVDLLSRSDEALGKTLLGWWIGWQFEILGFDVRNIPRDLAERLVAATQSLEVDELGSMPTARALALAAKGEFARAGKVLRQIISDGAVDQLQEQAAKLGRRIRSETRKHFSTANAERMAAATEARETWRRAGEKIRAKHPQKSNVWLARKIAEVTKGNANSIRAAIPEIGLAKKRQKI